MHRDCVITALLGYGQLTHTDLKARAEAIEELVDHGYCPRCGGPLPAWPDTSHAIADSCLPICNQCGAEEAITAFADRGIVPPIAKWAAARNLAPETRPPEGAHLNLHR